MALNDSGLVRLMTQKMAYLSQRQAVLGQNVANADTPGFKAKDLKPFSFNDALHEAHTGMKVTNSKHILPASMAGVNSASMKMKTYETVPSGNAVDIEQQMLEVSKTAIDYQATTSIFQKFVGLYQIALGKK